MRWLLPLTLIAVGCAARPIDFSDGGDASGDGGDDGNSGTSTTTGVPTPPDPGTTGPSTTTGPDPSTTDPGPFLDLGPPDPWPQIPLDVCASEWGPGTWVVGEGPFGHFAGNRAFNAMIGPWDPGALRIVILGVDVDAAKNIAEAEQTGMPQTGPALIIDTSFLYPDWFQTSEVPALMVRDGEVGVVTVGVDVFERLGEWNVWVPDDPPRVRGHVNWIDGEPFGFEGQFDAAYCGAFHEVIIGE